MIPDFLAALPEDRAWLDALTPEERRAAIAALVADPSVAIEPIPGAELHPDLVAALEARRQAAKAAKEQP